MDTITIGRDKSCDVVVTGDPTVSGVHCRLSRVDGKYIFENLGRNGSTLNGQLLNGRVVIAPNAPVMIGAKTQLPWVIIQRLLPLGPVVSGGSPRNATPQAPTRPVTPQPPVAPLNDPPYNVNDYPEANPDDRPSFGWWILSFFVPIVGLILFFVWKNTYPTRARKSCLIPAIIGFAINVTFSVISAIVS